MRAALKVMPPILLCWPPLSAAEVGGMAAEGHSDKMASDMEVDIEAKIRDRIPPCGKKKVPTDIHGCLLRVPGGQRVAVSTAGR